MLTVYKYELSIYSTLEIHEGATFLDVQMQKQAEGPDVPCAWFFVDTDAPKVERRFRIVGTGHPVEPMSVYRGTFQAHPFVWHVFEEFK